MDKTHHTDHAPESFIGCLQQHLQRCRGQQIHHKETTKEGKNLEPASTAICFLSVLRALTSAQQEHTGASHPMRWLS